MSSTAATIQIFVRGVTGKTTTLVVNPTDTVDSVKAKLEPIEGISPERQRIIFNGQQFFDGDRTLASYGVKECSTLTLCCRIGGPGTTTTPCAEAHPLIWPKYYK